MYNLTRKEEVLEAFSAAAKANAEKNLTDLKIEDFMKKGNADLVKECIEKIQSNVTSAIPMGIPIPKASLYVSQISTDAGEISLINLTITNKVKSTKKFKFSHVVKPFNAKEALFDIFLAVYTELIVGYMCDKNLERINEVVKEVAAEAGLSYSISVVSPLGNKGKTISYISDDSIVFVADEERLFDLDDLLVLQEPTEDGIITEAHIETAKKQLVNDLSVAQTPVQLVAIHGGLLISHLLDINKRVKPMTLLKKVTNRNVENLNGNKDVIAYYAKENVFSIVAKNENGFEVVLSPFDTETLRAVDMDIVATVEALSK